VSLLPVLLLIIVIDPSVGFDYDYEQEHEEDASGVDRLTLGAQHLGWRGERRPEKRTPLYDEHVGWEPK
jgi:hypothetical protein